MILKYSKAIYDSKISELESYSAQLDTHRSELEGYRERLRDIWNDEQGQRYYELLSDQIRAVKNASSRVTDLRRIYENASADLERQRSVTGDLLDEAKSILDVLNISDS